MEPMTQSAPWPEALNDLVGSCLYRPDWMIWLEDADRDHDRDGNVTGAGLTLVIQTLGYDAYHPERGQNYRVNHYFIVPAATYNRASWQRWLFDQFVKVETHEAMEYFTIGGEHPYAPNHGPGHDPYTVRELTTDEDRRTSFRGVVKT